MPYGSRPQELTTKPYIIVTVYRGSMETTTLWGINAESVSKVGHFNRCQRLELKQAEWPNVVVLSCVVDYDYPQDFGPTTRVDPWKYKNYEGPHPMYVLQQQLLKIQHRIEAENTGNSTTSPLGNIAADLNDIIATIPEPWKLTDR